MNKYLVIWNRKQVEIVAASALQAQTLGAAKLGVKRAYQVAVMLVERADGSAVTHSTASIG
jgi:hypothetical protein